MQYRAVPGGTKARPRKAQEVKFGYTDLSPSCDAVSWAQSTTLRCCQVYWACWWGMTSRETRLEFTHTGIYADWFGPAKSSQRPILRDFQLGSQDFDQFWVVFLGFQPRTPLKRCNRGRLQLGETKARNGFSTLKIGGHPAFSPCDKLLLTRKLPCRAPLGQQKWVARFWWRP